MPSTPKYGIPYPALTDVPDVPYWNQQQAQQVEATLQTLVAGQGSDVGFPAAATITTSELVLDRVSIAAAPYARRIHVVSHVYVTTSVVGTVVNLIAFNGVTSVGYARRQIQSAATFADEIVVTAKYDLAANVASVLEIRGSRFSGTGTITTSAATNLTNTNVLMMRT